MGGHYYNQSNDVVSVEWIQLAQDKVQCQNGVNTMMNFWVP